MFTTVDLLTYFFLLNPLLECVEADFEINVSDFTIIIIKYNYRILYIRLCNVISINTNRNS